MAILKDERDIWWECGWACLAYLPLFATGCTWWFSYHLFLALTGAEVCWRPAI